MTTGADVDRTVSEGGDTRSTTIVSLEVRPDGMGWNRTGRSFGCVIRFVIRTHAVSLRLASLGRHKPSVDPPADLRQHGLRGTCRVPAPTSVSS